MGGSSVPEQQITPQEREVARISEEKWKFFETHGKPTASRYVSAVTGFTVGEDGSLQVAANQRVRDASGKLRTDSSGAVAGVEAAFAPKMRSVNPNSGAYRGGLVDMEAAQLRSGTEADAGMRLGQQNRGLRGLENAVALGRGQQTSAIRGLSELAPTAGQKAAADAQTAFNDQSANRYLVGQLAGAGMTYGMGQAPAGQGLSSLAQNTATGGLYSLQDNGLKSSTGNRYYDPKNDFYA